METALQAMFDAMHDVVASEGSWQEKKNRILEIATEDQKTDLYEFVAWFE